MKNDAAASFLSGGGRTGALVRSIDWSRTPLGAVARWSPALQTAVGLLLRNRLPMMVFWGRELTQIYNDAWLPIFGARHPRAMGQPGAQFWSEADSALVPTVEAALRGEAATSLEDVCLFIDRRGFLEETHFEMTFGPVPDPTVLPSGVGGAIATALETTQLVAAERRLRTLGQLAAPDVEVRTPEDACRAAAATLGGRDVPFALFYLVDAGCRTARLAAESGFDARPNGVPSLVDLSAPDSDLQGWGLGQALTNRETVVVSDLPARFGALPRGLACEPPRTALTIPLGSPDLTCGFGAVVVGTSPHLPLDETYRAFFELAAGQVTTTIRNLLARQFERSRAEAVAEIGRAKTAFINGIGLLQTLFQNTPVPIAVIGGSQLVFEMANPAFIQVIGGRQVVGKSLLEAMPELAGQGVDTLLRRVMQTGTAHVGHEMLVKIDRRGVNQTEDSYWTFIYAALPCAAGQSDRVIGICNEVTEQVLARRKLEGLARSAEAANRAKDEFLAVLGHELRNPLSPIVTSLGLMKLRGLESKEVSVIERQVSHLVRLVDDLLDVSRITRGKIELRKQRLELRDVVLQAVETASPLLEKRHQRLQVEVPAGLVLEGDADRLSQVVSNLLTNASKYSEWGTAVQVSAARDGARVVLRVGDEGIGIAADMLDRIFDQFVQHPQSLDRSRGGLGLGLAIVRSLVTLHGGTVTAHSAGPGKGSEMVVDLPLAPASPPLQLPAAPTAPATAPPPPARARVLVVDDNPDLASSEADVLAELGYEVAVAHDGPSALAAAQTFKPTVCLLDLGLPVMDGFEVARRLRGIPELAGDLRIIAVSGYGQDADRRRSGEAGFNGHLVKPVSLDQLTSAVEP